MEANLRVLRVRPTDLHSTLGIRLLSVPPELVDEAVVKKEDRVSA